VTEGSGTSLIDAEIFTRSVLYIPLGRRVNRDVSIPVNLLYIQYLRDGVLLSPLSTQSFLISHDAMLFRVNSYDNDNNNNNNNTFSVVRLDKARLG